MNLSNYNILVVDDSIFSRKYFKNHLSKAGARVICAKNGSEGLNLCLKKKFSLILSDINMPVMNGFKFFKELTNRKIKIPRILITDADIDKYLHLAIENDIGNILSKNESSLKLINLCHKLITQKGLFGLKNYLEGSEKITTINIINSNQIKPTIEIICSDAIRAGMREENKMYLSILLMEVIVNAVYHAHGYSLEKRQSKQVKLKKGEKVEVCFGRNENKFGLAVTDFQGKLTKKRILMAFKSVIDQEKIIEESTTTSKNIPDLISDTGRGLQMIRIMSNDYYFNIKHDIKTQVIILININEENENNVGSININEVY